MSVIPKEMCELSRLQLLDLSENLQLHNDGGSILAYAPLNKVRCLLVELKAQHIDSLRCTWRYHIPESSFTWNAVSHAARSLLSAGPDMQWQAL